MKLVLVPVRYSKIPALGREGENSIMRGLRMRMGMGMRFVEKGRERKGEKEKRRRKVYRVLQ